MLTKFQTPLPPPGWRRQWINLIISKCRQAVQELSGLTSWKPAWKRGWWGKAGKEAYTEGRTHQCQRPREQHPSAKPNEADSPILLRTRKAHLLLNLFLFPGLLPGQNGLLAPLVCVWVGWGGVGWGLQRICCYNASLHPTPSYTQTHAPPPSHPVAYTLEPPAAPGGVSSPQLKQPPYCR